MPQILLMRAEANFRLGFDGNALPLVNQLRGRAQVASLAAVTEEDLDKEWLHEFVFEGLRQTVNIRFGTYFQPWWNKDATPTYKGVFPIPQSVLDKNPNLKQNPDYQDLIKTDCHEADKSHYIHYLLPPAPTRSKCLQQRKRLSR